MSRWFQKERDVPSAAQLAELSALADGSLDPTRRERVQAWVTSSPELLDLYERERAAVGILQRAALERAPARLRVRVQAQQVRPARRSRVAGYGALAGACAAAAVAAVLVVAGGGSGSPSVSQAAELARLGPSAPAPLPDSSDPRAKLAVRFQDVYFPNWSATLGWRAVGKRSDRLDGRPTTTVYYQRGAALVAYTIVGSPTLSPPSGLVTWSHGFELRAFSLGSRTVVTWRRAGHTCVLSAKDVPLGMLQQLAGWRAKQVSD